MSRSNEHVWRRLLCWRIPKEMFKVIIVATVSNLCTWYLLNRSYIYNFHSVAEKRPAIYIVFNMTLQIVFFFFFLSHIFTTNLSGSAHNRSRINRHGKLPNSLWFFYFLLILILRVTLELPCWLNLTFKVGSIKKIYKYSKGFVFF